MGDATLVAAKEIAALGARLSLVVPDTAPEMLVHSAAGNGQVFTLVDTLIFEAWLQEDARTRLERQDYPLLFWRDYGRDLLFLAVPPILLMFRRAVG